jgi:hypothetical protein
MTATPNSEVSAIALAEVTYKKRQKYYRVAMVFLGLASIARIPAISSYVAGGDGITLGVWVFASACVFITVLKAFRCTLCGGGIKLDLRTCSKCGHIFERH